MNRLEERIAYLQRSIVDNRWMLVIIVFLMLIAYGFMAYEFILMGDDWPAFQFQFEQYQWAFRTGRWLQRIAWETLGDNYPAPAFTLALMIIAAIASAGLQIKTIGLKQKTSQFVYIAVFLLFPFWVEMMPFKMMHGTVAISVLAGGAYGYLAYLAYVAIAQNRKYLAGALYIVLGAILFSFSASSYQPYIFVGTIAYVFGMIHVFLTGPTTLRDVLYRFVILVALVGIGVVLYLIEVNVSQAIAGVRPLPDDNPRALLGSLVSSGEELGLTFQRFVNYFRQFLFQAQHLFPVVVKYIFLVFLAVLTIYGFIGRIRERKYGWGNVFLIMACLLLIMILPWSLGIIRVPNTYRYAAIIANAGVYAGVIGLVLERTKAPVLRWVFGGLAALVIVIFVFQQNSASLVLHALNTRDMAIVNRITDRLETHPDYPILLAADEVTVIPIGAPDIIDGRPFRAVVTSPPMVSSIIECGIFDCQMARLPSAINRVQSGNIKFVAQAKVWGSLTSEQRSGLMPYLVDVPAWPNPDSIVITDEGQVLIVFQQPR